MDRAMQQQSFSHFTSFPQENPVRLSQVPKLVSHPPPRRVLPLQSPEEFTRNKLSPNWHPAALVPNNSTNIVSPVNSLTKDRLCPLRDFPPSHGHSPSSPVSSVATAREKLGPQHNMMQSRPGYLGSSPVVSTTLTNTQTSSERSLIPTIFHSTSPQPRKNLGNHLPSCPSRMDQGTESKILSSNSGKNNDVSTRQESNESRDEQIASSKSIIPVMDLNSISSKRRREGEPCFKNTKKPCIKGTNHGSTETAKVSPCTSSRSSPDPQLSAKSFSLLELSPETTDQLLNSESACLAFSSTLKPSRLNLSCSKKTPSTGAMQGFITTENNIVKLRLTSTPTKDTPKNQNEENQQKKESRSPKIHLKVCNKSPHGGPVCSKSDHTDRNVPIKTEGKKLDGSCPKPASKPTLSSLSGSTSERSKASRARKPVVVLNDIEQLFTPDPIVKSAAKTPKSKMEEQTIKSPTSKKGSSCSPTVTPTSLPVKQPPHVASSPASNLTVCLERLKLEKSKLCSKDGGVRKRSVSSSGRESTDENIKPQHNLSLKLKTNEVLSSSETATAASSQETSSPCTKSPPLKEEESERSKGGKEDDSIDVELDLGLSISYDIDITQSSDSSEEEPLISFQEMMERVTKPPDTPKKEAFSEPSTPGCRSSQSKTCLQPSTTKPGVYKNNLDQMLKEINSNKKAKELEAQLLTACNEDLLRLAEYEEAEDNEVQITTEHQEFLQNYLLMSAAIREIPPGEVVFNLEKFGQIFNQDTLQLRQCHVNPHETSQKTLLWSSPAQLKLHLNIGLFEEAYCSSPCPSQVTRFLFKMMSVHSERLVSDKILQVLCAIACSAAYQIVNDESQKFEVWSPSLADVTVVLINMGVAFVTLFPFESLQPSFTEGDLLEDVYIESETPHNKKEEHIFPEHNCTNILKYLSYCMGLCPRAYSDDELLLLLTVVLRISLETRRILQSSVEVGCLLYKMINNIRDWSSMVPRVCKALTDLTDDHHNMCLLVQLLPDSTRGKRLRRHLSMCFISKLLDGSCTYSPVEEELKLAELSPYLPKMQPSALLRGLEQKDKEEDMATQDQQAYYLCYSLLTLTNEASNLQVFKPEQKAQLLVLSSELETHVKCDIRESEKCLYRSKVKDLVARIYTKWQMLLQKTRPLNGKLYDYWQPGEAYRNTKEDGETISIEDEHEDEETTITDENDTVFAKNEEEEKEKVDFKEKMEVAEDSGDKEDDTETRETKAVVEQVAGMPLMEPPVMQENTDSSSKECTAMENETAGREEKSPPDTVM